MSGKAFDLSFILKFVDKFSGPLRSAANNFKALDRQAQKVTTGSLANLGAGLTSLGTKMSAAVTLPVVAGLYAASDAARDFEDAWTGVKKTVKDTAGLPKLRKDIIAMSRELPIATTELFNIAERAGQFGIATDNIANFTKQVAILSATTDIMPESSKEFARFIAASGASEETASNLAATLVELGNNFATSESEILAVGKRLAANAKLSKMNTYEALGLAAAMKHVGITTQVGGTSISRVFNEIEKAIEQGGKKLEIFSRFSGLGDTDDFTEAWQTNSAEAFMSLLEGMKRTREEGGPLFSALEALRMKGDRISRTLLLLSQNNDKVKESLNLARDAYKKNNAHLKEAEQRFETFSSQLQLFKNNFRIAFASFGVIINAILKQMIPIFVSIANWFEGLSDNTKKFLIVGGLLVAALGPILLILGSIVGMAALLVPIAGSFAAALGLIGTVGAWVFGIVVAIAGAIAYLKPVTLAVAEAIKTAVDYWLDLFSDFFDYVDEGAKQMVEKIKSIIPDFVIKWVFKEEGKLPGQEGPALARSSSRRAKIPGLAGSKSQSEVVLKLKSDPGTEATIEKVKKSGDTSLKVMNEGYLGFSYALGS